MYIKHIYQIFNDAVIKINYNYGEYFHLLQDTHTQTHTHIYIVACFLRDA